MSKINIHRCIEIKYQNRIERYVFGVNCFGILLSHKDLISHEDTIDKTEIRIWTVENIPIISKSVSNMKYHDIDGIIKEEIILSQKEMNEKFN